MPTTPAELLILLAALIPGFLGEGVYRLFVTIHWDEKVHWAALRLLLFSVAGVMLYVTVASLSGWPSPLHIFPDTFAGFDANAFRAIVPGYWGHCVGGALAGLAAGGARRLLGRFTSHSYYPAWDRLIRTYSHKRWVVVGIKGGKSYAGYISIVDTGVAGKERDLVLAEPAIFRNGNYVALGYQYLYLPANLISSIGVIPSKTDLESRLTKTGEKVFPDGGSNATPNLAVGTMGTERNTGTGRTAATPTRRRRQKDLARAAAAGRTTDGATTGATSKRRK